MATWIGWNPPHLTLNTKEYADFLAVKTSRRCLAFSPNALRCENSDPCLVKRASFSKWTFVTSASTVLIVARWSSVLHHTWSSSWCRPYTWTVGPMLRGVQVSSALPKKAGLLVWTAGRSAETEIQCDSLHVSAGTWSDSNWDYAKLRNVQLSDGPTDRITERQDNRPNFRPTDLPNIRPTNRPTNQTSIPPPIRPDNWQINRPTFDGLTDRPT